MNLRRRSSAAALATAAVLALGGCAPAGSDRPPSPRAAAPTSAMTSPNPLPSRPMTLAIRSIGITDAAIDPLGTLGDGSQEVPSDPRRVGWWKHGALLGASGSIALVGHTKSRGGGVFDKLGQLSPGDTVDVTSADSQRWGFTVESVEEVDVDDFAAIADSVYRTTGPSVLTLMTCGDFDGHEFDSTVVVRATSR